MDTVIAQREIEFRGYCDYKGTWVYGSLVQVENIFYIKPKESLAIFGMGLVVKPESVGQYTGLKDNHGNKVFEGDILKAFTRSFTGEISEISEHNALCFWSVSSFNFRLLPVSDNFGRCVNNYSHGFEIIGNVFDNPELLGEDND